MEAVQVVQTQNPIQNQMTAWLVADTLQNMLSAAEQLSKAQLEMASHICRELSVWIEGELAR